MGTQLFFFPFCTVRFTFGEEMGGGQIEQLFYIAA